MIDLLKQLAAGSIGIDPNAVPGNPVPLVSLNQNTVSGAFNSVLMIAGAIAVVFIVLGGIKYSTSQGDPGETKKAKETITYAIIGLVVVMLSFGILQLFTGRVF